MVVQQIFAVCVHDEVQDIPDHHRMHHYDVILGVRAQIHYQMQVSE